MHERIQRCPTGDGHTRLRLTSPRSRQISCVAHGISEQAGAVRRAENVRIGLVSFCELQVAVVTLPMGLVSGSIPNGSMSGGHGGN